VSLNSNTRDITNGSGTAYPSGAPEVHSGYSEVRVVRSLALCVVFSTSCFPKVFAINMRCVGSYIQGIYLNFNLMHFILKSIRLRYASSLNSLKIPKK
jgi:hypothetical protein